MIKTQIADLRHARTLAPTIKGSVKADYVQTDDSFRMEVIVPGNTSARLYLPPKNEKKTTYY